LQVVWEGSESSRWELPHLDHIEALLLSEVNALADLDQAFEFESARFLAIGKELGRAWGARPHPGHFRAVGPYRSVCFGGMFGKILQELGLDDNMDELVWNTLPPGVFLAAGVEVERWISEVLSNSEIPFSERMGSRQAALNSNQKAWIRNPATEVLYEHGYFEVLLGTHEDSLILLQIARAAIAAERYRLETGRYPAAWEEFVPRWLDAIPEDPWSGGSLVYRLDDEERPVIYSVGRNGIDEGGTPSRRWDEGDLVWRYSAAE